LQHDTTGACTLTRDGYAGGITVEEVDVLLDPLQSEMLIKDTCVDCTFAVDFVGGDKAERSKLAFDQSMSLEMNPVELTRY
jgi:hypothetical protein